MLIRFSSIGDIVLTTPVIRCLKQQSGAEIHFLCKSRFASLLNGNPHITKVYQLDDGIGELMPQLKKEQYDLVIDLHRNLRSLLVRLALRKKTLTFDKLNFRKWLYVRTKSNFLPDKHLVERYFEAVGPLGVRDDGRGLDYFFNDDESTIQSSLTRLIQNLQLTFDLEQDYTVFVMAAAHRTKAIPVEIASAIIAEIEGPVVFIGGEDYADEARYLSQKHSKVVDLCGRTRLDESAWIIKSSQTVISPDTGMMHIAAAFGKRIVSVWGNTVPDFGMYPFLPEGKGEEYRAEVKGLPCRPCSKLGFENCPKGHFKCMLDQDTAAIARWANNPG